MATFNMVLIQLLPRNHRSSQVWTVVITHHLLVARCKIFNWWLSSVKLLGRKLIRSIHHKFWIQSLVSAWELLNVLINTRHWLVEYHYLIRSGCSTFPGFNLPLILSKINLAGTCIVQAVTDLVVTLVCPGILFAWAIITADTVLFLTLDHSLNWSWVEHCFVSLVNLLCIEWAARNQITWYVRHD